MPPQVLHRPEQLAGATPLAHARVTVVKLHGDYADLDQRNTADELAEYPDGLRAYLSRILDEYGLIVSGWSADWDTALVHTLEETRSRRYPIFWSSYSQPGESARRLIALHGAVSLPGLAADDLFAGLLSRLDALDRLAEPPITAEIAEQRLKRALPDPVRRIELADLVNSEIHKLASKVTDTALHPIIGVPFDEQRSAYEEESAVAARLLATGVFHGDESHTPLWTRSLQRLVSARRPITGGTHDSRFEAMRHYPALLCLWAMGVSAILADRDSILAHLFLDPSWTPVFGAQIPQPAVRCLNPNYVIFAEKMAFRRYVQSQHIRAASRESLRQLEPNDDMYRAACDRLEYLASLVIMADEDESAHYPWEGEFVSRWNDLDREPRIGGLLEGGAFGGDAGRGKAARDTLKEWISQYGYRG